MSLGYFDTAERWLAQRAAECRDESCRAEVDSKRLDVLRRRGDTKALEAALKKFQEDYPWHGRASLADLERASETLTAIRADLERAAGAPSSEAAKIYSSARSRFAELDRGMEGLIKSFEKRLRSKSSDQDESERLVRNRDQTELARIKFHLVYARRLPIDAKDRLRTLERGLKLADEFVFERADFYVMQYDAQLQRGLLAYELGKYVMAESHLSALYSAPPQGPPPHSSELLDLLKELRLNALLFGSRALNAATNFRVASDTLKKFAFTADPDDPIDLTKVRDDPSLQHFGVLLDLEYGVALVGSGARDEGFAAIQRVIADFRDKSDAVSQGFVTDARRALGRIAAVKGVDLRGRDVYEAAQGLKSELRFADALDAFRDALRVSSERELPEMGPLCLNEIGELLFLLDRFHESAVAYAELFGSFRSSVAESAIAAKAANNFVAAVTKSMELTPGGQDNEVLQKLNAEANRAYERFGGTGLASEEALMAQAQQFEADGDFERARETYLKVRPVVERKDSETKVPFYWRAQASAEAMLFASWRSTQGEGASQSEVDISEVVNRLKEIQPQALNDGDIGGAATATLTLGQIHYEQEDWAAAVDFLQPFADGSLQGADELICAGLGFLTLAYVRQGQCEPAQQHFDVMRREFKKECADAPIFAFAALDLGDCFFAAGDASNAALYSLSFALHGTSKDDLRDFDTLVMVASRLASGAEVAKGRRRKVFVQQASRFLRAAKKRKSAKSSESRRQLVLIEAKVLALSGKEAAAEKKLLSYVERFGAAKGENHEDPFVFRDLAELLWKEREDGRRTTKRVESAARYYEAACALLERRLVGQPQLQSMFWQWALQMVRVRLFLAEAGDANSRGRIITFIKPRLGSEMGGLKKEFRAVLARVERLNEKT